MPESARSRIAEASCQLDAEALTQLRARLGSYRTGARTQAGWEQGVPGQWLDQLMREWRDFDFGAFERRLDLLPSRELTSRGQKVHFLQFPGRGPNPTPLLLTHGWPGSFLEHLELSGMLSDPAAHGAAASDAFTVIVPSLPGFGFSAAPPSTGLTAREVAALWHELMTEGLGFDRYVAHGSDLGAGVTAWLARDHPESVWGIHLASPGLAATTGSRTAAEDQYASAASEWTAAEGGYMHQHATKPATVGAALSDSPAGLAAWIGEKVVLWSSTRPDGSPAFDRDLLLSTLTLYWATRTITTSLLPYWTYRNQPGAMLTAGDVSSVPTAVSIFGGERVAFPKPPRELADRYYKVTAWAEHSLGGHFPAVAEPQLLAGTLRDFFRPFS